MKPIKPTKLAPEAYNRQLFENIKRREGVVPRVYSDPKGIPTIGIGHALAGWNETQEKHVLPEKPKRTNNSRMPSASPTSIYRTPAMDACARRSTWSTRATPRAPWR